MFGFWRQGQLALRLLQLLTEGHNLALQNYLRCQARPLPPHLLPPTQTHAFALPPAQAVH